MAAGPVQCRVRRPDGWSLVRRFLMTFTLVAVLLVIALPALAYVTWHRTIAGSSFATGTWAMTTNHPPVASADTSACAANGHAVLNVLANDTDPDGGPLTAQLSKSPKHGTVILSASGTATYTPDARWAGTDCFYYRASDGTALSAPAKVTIVVSRTPDRPCSRCDSASCLEDGKAIFNVLDNDTDPHGDPLQVASHSAPHHGMLELSESGAATYTPSPDFNGIDTFTYRATDGQHLSGSALVTVLVKPVNDPPSFAPGPDVVVSTLCGTYCAPWAKQITAGPANERGQTLTFTALCSDKSLFAVQPSLNRAGTLTFRPSPCATGIATITVTLADDDTAGGPALTSAPATFTIVVKPARAPLATVTRLTCSSGSKANKQLKLRGTITPAHAPGTVTIVRRRLVGTTWKRIGSATVPVVKGCFAWSIEPERPGVWHFLAECSGGVSEGVRYLPSLSEVATVKVR